MFFLGFFWFPWKECLDTCFFSNIIFCVYSLFFSCFRGFGCFLLFDFLFDLQLHWVLLFERLSALSSYALMCGALAMFFVSGGPRVCSAVVRSTLRSSSALVLWMLRWSAQCFILSATHLVVFKGMFLTNTGWVFIHHGCQNVTTNLQSWFSSLKKLCQETCVFRHIARKATKKTDADRGKQMQTDVNRCIQMYIHLFTSAYGLVGFLNADVNRCKQM